MGDFFEKLANCAVPLAPSTNGPPLLLMNVIVPLPLLAVTVVSPIGTLVRTETVETRTSTVPLSAWLARGRSRETATEAAKTSV
jgi:hypothetical protein